MKKKRIPIPIRTQAPAFGNTKLSSLAGVVLFVCIFQLAAVAVLIAWRLWG